jgi:ribulose-5-phosphate 4-epimerase/fuculose-1-phosphate aldolase
MKNKSLLNMLKATSVTEESISDRKLEKKPIQGQTAIDEAKLYTAQILAEKQANKSNEMLKYLLAVTYRIIAMEGLDEGISGHISMRVPGESDAFWVNPFGMLFEEVTPENIIKVNEDGKVLEGNYPINVAGFCIHAAIHKARKDVHAVVHTHSPLGVVFSATGKKLSAIDQNSCMFFEDHGLYDEYNGPVTDQEDATKMVKALGKHHTLILKNHGTITVGEDIETAAMLMIAAERAYHVNLQVINKKDIIMVRPDVANKTKAWIANPIGLGIEFEAYMRKAERFFPDLLKYKPSEI